ncbi:hypothetical protein M427DRAFT_408570 [Gonapodya prolifera JEL478]|uniref:Transmembrane protein 188 n=1 Tax=Gonapodya prolifera (strain JEL478) TaxID=1344416 RepID=A0A139A6A4_GONPJ|nr:hypothetical protein M427DRAFT_408570 [Gonapodya prolifera JEL478]|eukprot:KXS12188.1 hypothetical protein M427DRAFT_408570 [Gonapodya prolifera JEL478]
MKGLLVLASCVLASSLWQIVWWRHRRRESDDSNCCTTDSHLLNPLSDLGSGGCNVREQHGAETGALWYFYFTGFAVSISFLSYFLFLSDMFRVKIVQPRKYVAHTNRVLKQFNMQYNREASGEIHFLRRVPRKFQEGFSEFRRRQRNSSPSSSTSSSYDARRRRVKKDGSGCGAVGGDTTSSESELYRRR